MHPYVPQDPDTGICDQCELAKLYHSIPVPPYHSPAHADQLILEELRTANLIAWRDQCSHQYSNAENLAKIDRLIAERLGL